MTKPIVVTLCGSSKFRKQHEEAQARLTLEGKIVIPMGLYGHLAGIDMDGEIKRKLDILHFRKIDLSDEIFVVNPLVSICPNKNCRFMWLHEPIRVAACSCGTDIESVKMFGYIGSSTYNEIEYAKSEGKGVLYLNPVKDSI